MILIIPKEISYDSGSEQQTSEVIYDEAGGVEFDDAGGVELDESTELTEGAVIGADFDSSGGVDFDDAGGVEFDDAGAAQALAYLFDQYVSTQAEAEDLINVDVAFNNCDRVALFNLEATQIELELTDNDTSSVVQSKSIDLELDDGEFQQWIVTSMYIYANATLNIKIHNPGSIAKGGVCAIGLSMYIGNTCFPVMAGFKDYSIKDVNEFGYAYLNPGNWTKNPEIMTEIDPALVDCVYEDLVEARGKLVVIEGNNSDVGYEALRVYGFLKDWRIVLDNEAFAYVYLTINGVI